MECWDSLGIERSRRQKDAGKATHFIVGCASALLTCISLWFGDMGDGARIAAQIVSGIGFLGAGMIFYRRESMRGLTTAAGIWATAAIGMCAATGMYWLAIGTTALIIIFQSISHSKLFKQSSLHMLLVKLEYNAKIKTKLMDYFDCNDFHRFKISAVNEKCMAIEKTYGSEKVKENVVTMQKKLIAEAVIYPTDHYGADAIAQFISENPEILSIERLEDL